MKAISATYVMVLPPPLYVNTPVRTVVINNCWNPKPMKRSLLQSNASVEPRTRTICLYSLNAMGYETAYTNRRGSVVSLKRKQLQSRLLSEHVASIIICADEPQTNYRIHVLINCMSYILALTWVCPTYIEFACAGGIHWVAIFLG